MKQPPDKLALIWGPITLVKEVTNMRPRIIQEGEKFGKLTLVSFSHRNGCGKPYWNAKCDCGTEKVVRLPDVLNGKTSSCGCKIHEPQRTRFLDVGSKYGRLTVLEETTEVRTKKGIRFRYKCQCDCGNIGVYGMNHLLSGHTTSCGCFHKESVSKQATTHGLSKIKEYRIYHGMLNRCYDTGNKNYHNYGGRGIYVCERWKADFMNFYLDMGTRPSSKYSLDRIDNDGPYSPENCRWATQKEQANNKRDNTRYSVRGVEYSAEELSIMSGIKLSTLKGRLNSYGYSVEDAICYNVVAGNRRGEKKNLDDVIGTATAT